MPFLVILDRAVELPGTEVYAAQQSYARARGMDRRESAEDASEVERNPDGTPGDPDRPKLKRRPKSQP